MSASYASFTRQLGEHGPHVSAIGFGMMGMSTAYTQNPAPDEERMAFLDHVFASGVTNWDSSDSYGDSELLLGKWFQTRGKRSDVFLATKFGFRNNPDGTRYVDNSAEYIKEACSKSLERLGLHQIDLYYCHRFNSKVPVEKVVKAMAELKEEGKIKYIGLSECSADSLRRACAIVHVDAVQLEYSPFALEVQDTGLQGVARENGVAIVAYSPLGRGILTGRFKGPDDFADGDFRKGVPKFSKENFHKNLELFHDIRDIADAKGCTPGQLCLAWLLAQGPDVIPIPGTTSKKNFAENMAALQIWLTEEEMSKMREAIKKTQIVGVRYPPALQGYVLADTPPLPA